MRTYFSIFEIKKNVKKTLVFALLPFLRIVLARMHCSGKEKKVFEITSYLVRQDLKVVFVERRLTKKCQILSKFMVVQFHPPPSHKIFRKTVDTLKTFSTISLRFRKLFFTACVNERTSNLEWRAQKLQSFLQKKQYQNMIRIILYCCFLYFPYKSS